MKSLTMGVALAALAGAAATAQAVVVFDFNEVLPGQPSIGGAAPYARLTIQNSGANKVKMTLRHFNDSMGVDLQRFISELDLNYDPYSNDISVGNATTSIDFDKGQDDIREASLRFDLRFGFARANQGDRIGQGRVVTWDVTGNGVQEARFLATAKKTNGTSSTVYALLHMQGLGANCDQSTKLVGTVVPEPASMTVLGVATLALLRRRRKG